MKLTSGLLAVIVAAISACGEGALSSLSAPAGKMEGPSVKTLSHEDLMAVLHECHQYGSSDDPRVKYTIEYCSAAQSAHSMEGYTSPSRAPVDPTLNKMH